MPQITVIKPFSFAHHGYQVEQFEPASEPRETTDECAEIAIREGWAQPFVASKVLPAAPENKDAAPRRRTKA